MPVANHQAELAAGIDQHDPIVDAQPTEPVATFDAPFHHQLADACDGPPEEGAPLSEALIQGQLGEASLVEMFVDGEQLSFRSFMVDEAGIEQPIDLLLTH